MTPSEPDRTTSGSPDGEDTSRLPILCVPTAALAPVAIVVGDPARAERVAGLLEGAERVGVNREYVTYTGTRDGERVTVASHGVGAAGANVCFAELLRGGVRTLLRAGTCGAITEGVRDGELIIATSAVREDAVSDHLIPAGYPAAAHPAVTEALRAAARGSGIAVREGMIVTEANFYPGSEPPRWQRYRGYGPLAVEMELSSLYVLAAMNGARAGGILAVDGNLVDTRRADMSDYDPHREVVRDGVARMLDVVVRAAAALAGTTAA